MSQEVFLLTYQVPDASTGWQGNDVTGHVVKAPTNGQGGGITLLDAYFVCANSHGSGTAASLQLENWDTAGTAIKTGSGGTVAAAINGTADPLTANTPSQFTLSNAYLDAGEWLVLRKSETNSADFTRGALTIAYRMGR